MQLIKLHNEIETAPGLLLQVVEHSVQRVMNKLLYRGIRAHELKMLVCFHPDLKQALGYRGGVQPFAGCSETLFEAVDTILDLNVYVLCVGYYEQFRRLTGIKPRTLERRRDHEANLWVALSMATTPGYIDWIKGQLTAIEIAQKRRPVVWETRREFTALTFYESPPSNGIMINPLFSWSTHESIDPAHWEYALNISLPRLVSRMPDLNTLIKVVL